VKHSCALPPTRESVAAARRFVERLLARLDPDVAHTVKLMVSELATNCVRHAGTPYTMTVDDRGDEIRVEFRDTGEGRAYVRNPPPQEPHGRGLQIVSTLADDWGIEQDVGTPGKTTWFSYVVRRPLAASERRS
jgi:anti-sigma regulatory factor (Ser/Thr protein kinase)